MAKRKKVVDWSRNVIHWSNYHTARLECGHTAIVQLRKGQPPKTATCQKCI